MRDVNGVPLLTRDEHMRPDTSMQGLGALNASFTMFGELGGFDAVAIQAHPEIETVEHVHTAGNSSGIVDGAAAVLVGSKRAGKKAGLTPRATDQGLRQYRVGAGADADRPGRRDEGCCFSGRR